MQSSALIRSSQRELGAAVQRQVFRLQRGPEGCSTVSIMREISSSGGICGVPGSYTMNHPLKLSLHAKKGARYVDRDLWTAPPPVNSTWPGVTLSFVDSLVSKLLFKPRNPEVEFRKPDLILSFSSCSRKSCDAEPNPDSEVKRAQPRDLHLITARANYHALSRQSRAELSGRLAQFSHKP